MNLILQGFIYFWKTLARIISLHEIGVMLGILSFVLVLCLLAYIISYKITKKIIEHVERNASKGAVLSSMVEELISSEDEVIRLRIDEDNNITMWILMNDTFDYACADGEDVTLQEIELVYKSWKKFGWDGVTAFVSNKRGELPLQQLQSEKFHEAIKFIKDTKE